MPLLSERYPVVYAARVGQLRLARRLADRRARPAFAERRLAERLPDVVVGHESLLRRRLGTTDPALQDSKVENLRIAIRSIDGLVLAPGETFSFWRRVGPPTAGRGYREGLILRGGRPAAGVGGGRLRSSRPLPARYEVYEVGHRFEQTAGGVVRCNEVWRRRIDRATGRVLEDERLMENRSRVAYEVDPLQLEPAG